MTTSTTPTADEIGAYLETVPARFRTLTARALRGEARSPRAAIKVKCLACSNFTSGEVGGCRVWRCPLWPIRPYQEATDGADDSLTAAVGDIADQPDDPR